MVKMGSTMNNYFNDSSDWRLTTATARWAIYRGTYTDSLESVKNIIVGVGELTREEVDAETTVIIRTDLDNGKETQLQGPKSDEKRQQQLEFRD